jgi:cysteine desulfurase / selenocysteine lyase
MSISVTSQFPIFKKYKKLVYLDSANSSQKPISVINAIDNFYRSKYSNIGRGVYTLAANATEDYESTRSALKEFLKAYNGDIIFTKNATESLNLVAKCFGENFLNPGDEILLSELEHHSNYVPWHFLRKKKIMIKFIPVNKDGNLDITNIKSLITNKTKIISLTHISNVTGKKTPLKKIIEVAKSKNIPVCIDGTQAVAHTAVNIKELDCDFYAFSGHKMYAATGVGCLFMKDKWFEKFNPFLGGGGMIQDVDIKNITFANGVSKFEAGTMPAAEVISLKFAIDFLKTTKIKNIEKHENELISYAISKFNKMKNIIFVGKPDTSSSLFSFNIKGIHAHDVSTVFDQDSIAVRAGHHCCQILHKKFNIASSLRVSVGVYNVKQDIDALCESILKCKKLFKIQ